MGRIYLPKPRSVFLPRRGFAKPARPAIDWDDPINRGLVGCWPLGEHAPIGWAQDISGNGSDGTLTNSPTLAPSHHGGHALAFDGSTSFVSIPANNILNSGGSISISVWVNFVALAHAYSAVFSLNSGGVTPVAFHQILVKSTGKLAMFIRTAVLATVSYDGGGANTLVTGNWYHLGLSYDVNTGLLGYFNGEFDGNGGVHSSPLNSDTGILTTIGKDLITSGRIVNGSIEGARQWNRVLKPWEFRRLYSEPYAGIVDSGPKWRIGQSAVAPTTFSYAWVTT